MMMCKGMNKTPLCEQDSCVCKLVCLFAWAQMALQTNRDTHCNQTEKSCNSEMLTAKTLQACCDRVGGSFCIRLPAWTKRNTAHNSAPSSQASQVPKGSQVFAMALGERPGPAVVALYTSLVLFGQFSVDSVLKSAHYSRLPRDLDVVELWSGVGTIVTAGLNHGLACLPFDKDRVPGETETEEDITSLKGFQKALSYVMRLKFGAYLHMAPVCSSFVFANSCNCQRSSPHFEGNLLYEAVSAGNLMARIAAFLMLLAHARDVYASTENPSGSMFFNYRPVKEVFDALGVVYQTTDGCCFSTKKPGERYLKRFKFAANGPWINKVFRRCKCPNNIHIELMSRNEKGGCSGTKDLKLSQAYPKSLGKALVLAWLADKENAERERQCKESWTFFKPSHNDAVNASKAAPKRGHESQRDWTKIASVPPSKKLKENVPEGNRQKGARLSGTCSQTMNAAAWCKVTR